MNIPQYLLFPNKESDRSQLHNFLVNHQTNKLTIEKVEAISARDELEKKKVEDDEILNALGLYEENEISPPEKWDFSFRQYIISTYPNLKDKDIKLFIESGIDNLKLFLRAFVELIRYPKYESNTDGNRVPNTQKLEKYLERRKKQEIKTFFKSLEYHLIPFGGSILKEDKCLRKGEFGIFHFYDAEYISSLLKFCIIQYREILETILIKERQKDQINEELNPLINDLKYSQPDIYNLLMKAINKKVIYLDDDNKIHFPYSQNTVSTFFKKHKIPNKRLSWIPIIENIVLENGALPNSSIKNAPEAPETAQYQEFISKILS